MGSCVRETKWFTHKTKYPLMKALRQNCSLTTNNMNHWVRFQHLKFKADGVLIYGTHEQIKFKSSDVTCEEQGKILATGTMQLNYN